MSAHDTHGKKSFAGPKCWIATLVIGLLLGALFTKILPASYAPHTEDSGSLVEQDHGDAQGSLDHALPDPVAIVSAEQDTLPALQTSEEHGSQANDSKPDQEAGQEVGGDAEHDQAAGYEDEHGGHGPTPVIPIILLAPFILLLGSVALMPFINAHFWHEHFPDFAFLLGGIMVSYYLLGFSQPGFTHGLSYGQYKMLHAGQEYYAFIALIGGLFIASGGILVDYKGRGGPVSNTILLAFGAIIANVVGTTGASVLLIRPFMRMNKGRLRPIHVVMFIFIVSNCGGCLTPIGDPPLYLGYLKGIPFSWTMTALWPMWLTCVGILLVMFFVIDRIIGPAPEGQAVPISTGNSLKICGMSGIFALALIIGGVFIDPLLKSYTTAFVGIPVGPTFQIIVALTAYKIARQDIHTANEFNFFPVKEVGLLFVGIFATMAPALGYLETHGDKLGIDTHGKYYFATGALSAVLDNAPTYLNFLQVTFAAHHIPLTADNVHRFLAIEEGVLSITAISLGAVFFGAMTYIGNGPNFMVRAIAEASGLRMPSFFGYMARSIVLLLPVLIIIWFIFIR